MRDIEEKLFTLIIVSLFVCIGYLTRSFIQVALYDGLIVVVMICLAVLVVIGSLLWSETV